MKGLKMSLIIGLTKRLMAVKASEAIKSPSRFIGTMNPGIYRVAIYKPMPFATNITVTLGIRPICYNFIIRIDGLAELIQQTNPSHLLWFR